jgi:hypothetical protein
MRQTDLATINIMLGEFAQTLFIVVLFLGVFVFLVVGVSLILLQWLRFKSREEVSLNFVLLELAVPHDNEVKIDAMEQVFSSLSSIKQGGVWQKFKSQNHLSFEIIAKKEEIKFYVSCHRNQMELVEKLLAGAYSGIQVKEVDEVNNFDDKGKVALTELVLKKESFRPIKVFKELTTDPLSSITASMAKFGDGEAAAIQMIIVPAEGGWASAGESYIAKTKKSEADPEKAKFKMSPADMEAIDNKCGKPGFLTAIRIVTVAPTKELAKQNLSNLKGSFAAFNGPQNGFSGKDIKLKGGFMVDFIYRYQSLYGNTVLNTEELATVWHLPNKTIDTPHIYWLNARSAPATGLSDHGLFMGRFIEVRRDRSMLGMKTACVICI